MIEGKPSITPELLARFRAYYLKHPTWGSLHVVLDDDNLHDAHVAYCLDWAEGIGDEEGAALARILLPMSRSQRGRIARRACRPSAPAAPEAPNQ